MRVTVEYAAQIKRAVGVPGDEFEFENSATLAELVRKIADLRGDALQGTLFTDEGKLHLSILVFVGDLQVRDSENQSLSDGDVVTFLSPISGG